MELSGTKKGRFEKKSINCPKQTIISQISETNIEALTALKKGYKTGTCKGWEWLSACKFPQYYERMEELLRSAVECTAG